MKKVLSYSIYIALLFFNHCYSQTLYYPPVSSTEPWETTDAGTLGWCPDRINNLYNFLEQENTKGFIVLKDGKIVLERYFGTHTAQSPWYWASAAKTITSFLVGKAQEENYLNIGDRTSQYLGEGWTSCTLAQENNITIRDQLSMTSGLDDGVPDNHCTLSTCLNYLADGGTRWAYHNAPYTLLDDVLQTATTLNLNTYTQQKLKNPTGMTGSWATIDFNNVFFSNARSMARFGLLIQGNGSWNGNQLINSSFFNAMVNTSQNLNQSYGYLWWLNGKQSYMLPTTQLVFPGSYAPNAPSDMIAGLGRDGQIVSISPSRGLVFVRMGEAPSSGSSEITTLFCNQIWQKINELECNLSADNFESRQWTISPNPATNSIEISNIPNERFNVEIISIVGTTVLKSSNQSIIDVSALPAGLYIIFVSDGSHVYRQKLIIE